VDFFTVDGLLQCHPEGNHAEFGSSSAAAEESTKAGVGKAGEVARAAFWNVPRFVARHSRWVGSGHGNVQDYPRAYRPPAWAVLGRPFGLNARPRRAKVVHRIKDGDIQSQIQSFRTSPSQESNKEIAKHGALSTDGFSIGVQWRKRPIRFRRRIKRWSRWLVAIPLELRAGQRLDLCGSLRKSKSTAGFCRL
jgi:hypothetical protein